MNNPSRYDADLVKRGMEVIQAEIDRMSKTGMRNISEQMAARGLTGSSLEGFAASDLQGELGRYGNERAFNLAQDQARTWAQDSSTAFGMGLGATGLPFAALRSAKLVMTDKLIAATAPLYRSIAARSRKT